jgi:hypothetical protein
MTQAVVTREDPYILGQSRIEDLGHRDLSGGVGLYTTLF